MYTVRIHMYVYVYFVYIDIYIYTRMEFISQLYPPTYTYVFIYRYDTYKHKTYTVQKHE